VLFFLCDRDTFLFQLFVRKKNPVLNQ